MSANKTEAIRDKKEARERMIDREKIEMDIKLDQKADRQLTEIKRLQKELHKEMKSIRKKLDKLQKK